MVKHLLLGVGAVLFVTACSSTSSSTDSLAPAAVDAVSWSTCTGKDAPKKPFECATVTVPLDYSKTGGELIEIALVRYPAADAEVRAGVLLTNPGGPGASGFDFVSWAGPELSQSLSLPEFDIVGFDPRGVDRSGGLRCSTDAELDKFQYLDTTPDTETEKALFTEYEDDESTCEDKLGSKITLYSTENIARDMDSIRAAMGVDTIHFLGISYGTYLGGVYASLFPSRVASMVLDSAFDPQGDTAEQQYTTQLVGFENAYRDWVSWCESNTTCAFTGPNVAFAWQILYDQLDKKSLIATDKREVNHKVLTTATRSALYARSEWSTLAAAIKKAGQGNGDALQAMADHFNDRNKDGSYKSSNDSFYIIRCASGFGRNAPNNADELVSILKKKAPWAARKITVEDFKDDDCEGVFDNQKLFDIDYAGNGPVVVIGGEKDPATPVRWSEEMTNNLGPNASLVRFTGAGHSQILVSRCVDLIAADVFAKKELPLNPTICDPDVPVAEPRWWQEAVDGLNGTPLDSERMLAYFGVKIVDAFAEAFALRGDGNTAFAQVRRTLEANGYRWSKQGDTDSTKQPQFFVSTADSEIYVGVFLAGLTELTENKMFEPNDIVPSGSSVALIYWFS